MEIGCVLETMKDESRVALRPSNPGVAELLSSSPNNVVRVAQSAGKNSGFQDSGYERAGALILPQEEVWRHSELIMKVKQPLEEEFSRLEENCTLLCFLHLADNHPLLNVLLEKKITAIAYETIRLENGSAHILAEMSKIAGRSVFFDSAELLKKHRGMLIGPESKVLILGLGNAGKAAAELVAAANPKMLYLLDKNPGVFEPLERRFYKQLSPYDLWFMKYDQNDYSDQKRLATILQDVDLLIAATYIDGELQAKAVPEWMELGMKPGAVTADISIDQGGALESSNYYKETGKQIFKKHGVWHYCVPNIPGKVPLDSTPALTRETFPYILALAEKGLEQALVGNPALRRGVNTYKDWITHEGLARSVNRMKDYKPLNELL